MNEKENEVNAKRRRPVAEGVSYPDIGRRIKNLRVANQYNRENFAEKIGISDKFLYEIELGKKGFSVETLYKIARALSVSSDYILEGKEKGKISKEMSEIIECFPSEQMECLTEMLSLLCEMSVRGSSQE